MNKCAFSVLLCLLGTSPILSQTNILQSKFSDYNKEDLHEKIFVHSDKGFYVAGEIMWFKVYCTDENNRPLNLSKVAYIEVLDQEQHAVMQAKIAMTNGAGNGSLPIPSDLHSGNYNFRAYTSWMKNYDPEFYFHQPVTIVNTLLTDTVANQKLPESYELQFFPEGGYLVNDLESKVAFKVSDNSGKGSDCAGVLTDQNNDTILHFRTALFGIGNFRFTPKKEHQYTATITTSAGKVITQKLPQPLNNGYVMQLTDLQDEGKLRLTVQNNTGSKSMYLFVHAGSQVENAQVLSFSNGSAAVDIDKSKLGDGISHITIFDNNNEPVCERLYFKRPQQQLVIDAKADGATYLPRKKITVDLDAKDQTNLPQSANMSMAVFLVDSTAARYSDIYSYLWLSSDLRGRVESPEYYFQNNTPAANQALDNLMLTHGWRRFKWNEVLQDKNPVLKFLPEYEGQIVSGRVVNRNTELPVENVPVFLSLPGTHFQLYSATSGSDGMVHFNTSNLYGTRLMVALANTADTTSYRVDLSNPFSENFSSESLPPFSFYKAPPSALLRRSINMQVQNAFAAEKLNSFAGAKTDSLSFYGKPDAKYSLDDYTRFPTMEEVLREYVLEIAVRKRRDQFSLTMVNKDENGNPIVREPVVLLDGVPQFDFGNKITHYDPLKVKKLETINEPYFLGSSRFDGIASFFTYNGNLEGFQLDPSSTVLDYEGLQLRREFYTPSYESSDSYASRIPDFRTLLYWAPDIVTDNNGKKQIQFYSSDLTGRYAIVVQGITQQGNAGSKVIVIDVNKGLQAAK